MEKMDEIPIARASGYAAFVMVAWIAGALVVTGTVTGSALSNTYRGEPLPETWTWFWIVVVDVMVVWIFGFMAWRAWRQIRTVFTHEGLIQPHPFTARMLRWEDVEQVTVRPFIVEVKGHGLHFELLTAAYKRPNQLMEVIAERVPFAMPRSS